MNQIFYVYILNRCVYKFFKESKRFAGHSKWQNIRHQKEANDAERAALHLQLRKKIRDAVLSGGSAKPATNEKLARVIEQCKRLNMPARSINSVLEKFNAVKEASEPWLIEIKGPQQCVMIIKVISNNIIHTKSNLNNQLKKVNAKIAEGLKSCMFEHNGIVIVEKKHDLERAMEDAMNIGATDIEEIDIDDDNSCYKLKCEPQLLSRISTQLKNLDYHVISTDEEIIPLSTIKFNNEDLKIIKSIQEKLLNMDEVHKIYDNVDRENL